MSRQRFGQHFLSSPHILERIAIAACGDHAATVVEIGPGRGALTEHLLRRVDRLIAVEVDPALIPALEARFAGESKLTIVHGDAMACDFGAWSPDALCGNLPYYVATSILDRSVRNGIRTTALIQKEVADRILAQPGTREYGYLTCSIGLFADAKYRFGVKPGSFHPPPKVDSSVISLEPRRRAEELGVDADAFLKFLAACFHLKRKTLRNNLSQTYSLAALDAIPGTSKRGEECSLSELAALYHRVTAEASAGREA